MGVMSVVLLWLLWSLIEVHSQTIPNVSFMGNSLPNHAYIDLSQVGNIESNSVHCYTDLVTCCSGSQGPHRGDWYPPNGETRLPFNGPNEHIFEQRSNQEVELRRKNIHEMSAVSGIYRCDIETNVLHNEDGFNTSARETVYVGLCESGGDITIVDEISMKVDTNESSTEFTLTCISIGGPATAVTWTRNLAIITEGTETVLHDRVTAQYTHTLTVTGRLGGLYTCTVANNKPSMASTSILLEETTSYVDHTAVQEGLTGVRVSWIPPTFPIMYTIHHNGSNGGTVDIRNLSTDNYLLTDLHNGASYSIIILAKTVLVTPYHSKNIDLHKPVINETSVTATSIFLSWTFPNGAMVNISEVMWQRDTSGECSLEHEDSALITDGYTTNYTIKDVQENSNYSVTIRVTNIVGVSALSNTVEVKTLETVPSAAPSNVRIYDVTSSSMTVQWGTVECIHRNGEITAYIVRYGEQGTTVTVENTTLQTALNNDLTLSGLSSATVYRVEVAAMSRSGRGLYSDVIEQLTLIEAPVLSVESTAATSISLSWTSPRIGINVTIYEIIWQRVNSGECIYDDQGTATVTNGSTVYIIMNVQEDSRYSITVTANNIAGGTHSNTITTMTEKIEAAPSAAPSDVIITEVTCSNITVYWGEIHCIDINGNITGYSLRYGVAGSDSSQTMYVSHDIREATISSLIPSTTYYVEVAALHKELFGPYSNPVTRLTEVKDVVLSVDLSTATSISLSWTSAGSMIATYEVLWQRDTSGECPDEDSNSATITDGSTSLEIIGCRREQ